MSNNTLNVYDLKRIKNTTLKKWLENSFKNGDSVTILVTDKKQVMLVKSDTKEYFLIEEDLFL